MSTPRAGGKKTSAKAFRDKLKAQFFPDWDVKPGRRDEYSLGSKDFVGNGASKKAVNKAVKEFKGFDALKSIEIVRIPLGLPDGRRVGRTIELKGFTHMGSPMKINVVLDGGASSLPLFLPCDLYEQRIVDFADSLKERLLAKYRKGRKEHGGSPTNVDCQAEVNQEVLDIINYFLIDKVNGNAKKA